MENSNNKILKRSDNNMADKNYFLHEAFRCESVYVCVSVYVGVRG